MRNCKIQLIAFLFAMVLGVGILSAQTKTIKHIVDRGETLESIAKRYGTTNQKIIELNPDAEQFIYVGMELLIPATDATEKQATNTQNSLNAEANGKNVLGNNTYFSQKNNENKEVLHRCFIVAQYQLGDFNHAKYSSNYGLGILFPSIANWGALHVGGDVNFSINAGIVKEWGCLIDFGPSVRYDIAENVFFNMPINVRCVATFPKGTTKTRTDWGMLFAPALHVFLTQKFGIYVGPEMNIGFQSGSKPSFGLVAGISYEY